MTIQRVFTLFFIQLVFIVLLPCSVAASQIEETIIVTASRSKLPANQVGSSVHYLTLEDLESRQGVMLGEILREIPGLAVSRQGGLGAVTQIRVRGAEGNHVMVLIDGVEANDPAQGSEFNFAHLLSSDIARVEVVKGPQSALWGSDALGGVINIITREAESPLSLDGIVESGSHESNRGSVNLSARGEKFHIRLSNSYMESAGENISRQGGEEDGYRNETYNLKAGYQANERILVNVNLRQVHANNEYDTIDFFTTGLPVDADFETETDQTYGRVDMHLDLFSDRWQQMFSVARTKTDNINRELGPVHNASKARRTNYVYQSDYHLESNFADQVVTLAFDYESEDYAQRGPSFGIGFDPNKNLHATTRSWVLEYRASLDLGLDFSASGRSDRNSEFDDSTTYRFSTAYRFPRTNSRVYIAYSEGSKNPSFTERFGYFDSFTGNPDLQPEHSVGRELGLEQTLLNEQLRVNLVWFDEELRDEIDGFVFDPDSFGFTAANRVGRSDRSGLEFSAQYQPVDQFSASIAYTYLDAEEPETDGAGQDEVRRPRHTASLNLDYYFNDRRGNLNLGVIYTGDQIDDFFPPWPASPERVELQSFTLLNLSGSWRLNEQLSLFGRIENALDEDYEEVYGFTSRGRAVYAGMKFSFSR